MTLSKKVRGGAFKGIRVFLLAAGSAAFCLLLFDRGVIAQTAQPKTLPDGGQPAPTKKEAPAQPTWMVNCTNVAGGFDCRASQTLYFQKSRTRALTFAVQTKPAAKNPVILMQLPFGVYLPGGVTLQIGDQEPKRLPILSCDQAGCLAEYAVTDTEIGAMKRGADVTIAVQDNKKSPVNFRVPSKGFDAAYAKIK